MSSWDIFWREMIDRGGYTLVLQGLRTTVVIAVCGLLIGLVLGSILAIFKLLPRGRV